MFEKEAIGFEYFGKTEHLKTRPEITGLFHFKNDYIGRRI